MEKQDDSLGYYAYDHHSSNANDYCGKHVSHFPDDFCCIDLETTGINPYSDHILEICLLKVRANVIVEEFASLVKPPIPIAKKITKINGITNELVQNAPSLESIAPSIYQFIEGEIVLGYNVLFDIRFLHTALSNSIGRTLCNDYFDVLPLSRRVNGVCEDFRLSTVASSLDVAIDQAHRARSDVEATIRCYQIMRGMPNAPYRVRERADRSSAQSRDFAEMRTRDITSERIDFNTSHPLFGKLCVFTGELSRFSRHEAARLVCDCGGQCGDAVTRKTDYLFVADGQQESTKLERARSISSKGNKLVIASEALFYQLVEAGK